MAGEVTIKRDWSFWLGVVGSVASISALAYLIWKIENGEDEGVSVAGLPKPKTLSRRKRR